MRKSKKKLTLLFIFSLFAINLFGSDGTGINILEKVTSNSRSIDMIWVLIAAFLVFFMQAGFGMLEAGLTRAKNAGNILMKNTMDFTIGSLAFWAIGFGIMFGTDKLGLFGTSGFFLSNANPTSSSGLWTYVFWLFQAMFAAAAASIVAGAVAERTKFTSYLLYSLIISMIIYPISGHWIWGGGWLSKLGFIDFAGSTAVHTVGGIASLVGAIFLGPRLGKYDSYGKPKMLAGHNMPLASLGLFILWFGWFGFNAGSTLSGLNKGLGLIAVNTNLSAAAGAVVSMMLIWIIYKKPDLSMTINGALAGLVAVTAPSASISPASAVIIGTIAGILVVLAIEFIDKILKIDDPVGAVAVHGINGIWGTLAVGLFAQAKYGQATGAGAVNGLFFGGGLHQFKIQLLGSLSVVVWVVLATIILFGTIKKTIGLRVSREEELKGLDLGEHGLESYSGFQILN